MKYPDGVKSPKTTQLKPKQKYHAQKIKEDGITFDSKAEYNYYLLMKQQNLVFDVHRSFEIIPKFEIDGKKHRARRYSPDFVIYSDSSKSKIEKVVDVKGGKITVDASLRMTLFEYQYKIAVVIAKYNYRKGGFAEKNF